MRGLFFHLAVDPAVKFFQACDGATDDKIIFAFYLLRADLFRANVFKSDPVRHVSDHGDFLSDGIHQVKLCFGEKDGQGYARKTSTGSNVKNTGAFVECGELSDAK